MQLPSISNYGNYSSDNYGAHSLQVSLNGLTVWFSYRTPVAFQTAKTGLVCRENEWGPTTGKHLNWIEPDRKKRVSGATFEAKWAEALASL